MAEFDNQRELFGAEELFRIDQGEMARAEAYIKKMIDKTVGSIIDNVMDQSYQVMNDSANKLNILPQIEEIANESDMDTSDVLMEMDEFYEVSMDLSLVAVKAIVHALMRSLPHPVDPEDLAEMANSAWED